MLKIGVILVLLLFLISCGPANDVDSVFIKKTGFAGSTGGGSGGCTTDADCDDNNACTTDSCDDDGNCANEDNTDELKDDCLAKQGCNGDILKDVIFKSDDCSCDVTYIDCRSDFGFSCVNFEDGSAGCGCVSDSECKEGKICHEYECVECIPGETDGLGECSICIKGRWLEDYSENRATPDEPCNDGCDLIDGEWRYVYKSPGTRVADCSVCVTEEIDLVTIVQDAIEQVFG